MNLDLIHATQAYKEVIANLMQLYMYDFSVYIEMDVEEDGLFKAYAGLEDYWKDSVHKFPYLIRKEDKWVGFVLVQLLPSPQEHYSIAEFFVLQKYRRGGIGRTAAKRVFDLHKGQWLVHQRETNHPAQAFWRKVIHEYTKGRFLDRFEKGRRVQSFKN
ncbi:MAG: GNAT family N-acetyltransferase [Williamsia sp.]|nr:GNAT family N-acetyltransferase [Williamsia sp.]